MAASEHIWLHRQLGRRQSSLCYADGQGEQPRANFKARARGGREIHRKVQLILLNREAHSATRAQEIGRFANRQDLCP